MAETGSISSKKKRISGISETKSVKFNKLKTLSSQKKKFAKTPHSSKTQGSTGTHVLKNKRKLNFSNADDSESPEKPLPSPIVKKKKKMKTLNAEPFPAEKTAKVKKVKVKKLAEPVVADLSSDDEPTPSKKRKSEDTDKKAVKKKKKSKINVAEISEEQKLKEKQEYTVFVGNLPPTMTTEGITKAFSKFGNVRSARLRCIPLKPEAKSRKSGAILKQFSGMAAAGFVKFKTGEEAQKALALNGTLLNGSRIRVDLADPAKRRPTNAKKAVFLRNLHFQLTDDELWKAFENCGQIKSVRIIKDKRNYLGRGLGYVNFDSTSAVELALKMDGTEIKGRPVSVHRCDYQEPRLKQKKTGLKQIEKEGKPKKEKKKKKKKSIGTEESVDFKGKKSQPKKKVKKKLSADGLKKKKIAQVLTAK